MQTMHTATKSPAEFTTAIIVNYNSGAYLSACVASLIGNLDRIVVVDNASSDHSLEALEQKFSGLEILQLIRNQHNAGFAAACNVGLNAAPDGRLLFLNPDCVLPAGTFERLKHVLTTHPEVGMVGGLLVNPDGTEQGGGRRAIPTPWRSFVRAFGLTRWANRWPRLFFDFHLHNQPLPTVPVEVEAISGACMLVRREAMNAVDRWDEGYFLHCEDLDFSMTLRQCGWKILFVPDAIVVHDKGVCSRSRPIFVEWHKHRGMVRFYRKYFRHQYTGVLWVFILVGVWIRFALLTTWHLASLIRARIVASS